MALWKKIYPAPRTRKRMIRIRGMEMKIGQIREGQVEMVGAQPAGVGPIVEEKVGVGHAAAGQAEGAEIFSHSRQGRKYCRTWRTSLTLTRSMRRGMKRLWSSYVRWKAKRLSRKGSGFAMGMRSWRISRESELQGTGLRRRWSRSGE
jgi:hypothetical protein